MTLGILRQSYFALGKVTYCATGAPNYLLLGLGALAELCPRNLKMVVKVLKGPTENVTIFAEM